jgi:hypothetical protein
MQNVETVLNVLRDRGTPPRQPRNSHWRARCLESGHDGFGRGPSGKGPAFWHLAGRPTSLVFVLGQDRAQVPSSVDQPVVEALAAQVPMNRSAWALARCERGGVATARMPAAANTASNAAVNLASRSLQ